MQGAIKFYDTKKGYGFIETKEKDSYFFHKSSIDAKDILEGSYVEFEKTITKKGEAAINIKVLQSIDDFKYEIPEKVYFSKNSTVKGWEVIEKSNWQVHGTSENSPDDAKNMMLRHARLIGGNCVVDAEYYKTTGSEAGTGKGTHYFTIHNFKGRVINIGKKSINGKLKIEDFPSIEINGMEVNNDLEAENEAHSNKMRSIRIILGVLSFIPILFNSSVGWIFTIAIIVVVFLFTRSNDYSWWLERR